MVHGPTSIPPHPCGKGRCCRGGRKLRLKTSPEQRGKKIKGAVGRNQHGISKLLGKEGNVLTKKLPSHGSWSKVQCKAAHDAVELQRTPA